MIRLTTILDLFSKQRSPPAGNRKRRTASGITGQSISYPEGAYLGRVRGYLPWPGGGGTYLGRGRGYLPWPGGGGTYLGRERGCLPWPGGGGTYLGRGGYLPWQGEGVPTLAGEGILTLTRERGTYLGWGYLPRYPSPPWCLQTDACEKSTFPILRMRTVNKKYKTGTLPSLCITRKLEYDSSAATFYVYYFHVRHM